MKRIILLINTSLIALAISACSHNPHRTIEAYDSESVIVKIINHDEALRQLDLPTCHFEGC